MKTGPSTKTGDRAAEVVAGPGVFLYEPASVLVRAVLRMMGTSEKHLGQASKSTLLRTSASPYCEIRIFLASDPVESNAAGFNRQSA